MTRKQLAEAIYDLDEVVEPHMQPKAVWVKRALNGCGPFKGFKKAELEAMLARRQASAQALQAKPLRGLFP
jgi:hypothetical protein